MASLITRVGGGVRKALSSIAGTTVTPWLFGGGVGVAPREPFAGAWQRNMDSHRSVGSANMASSSTVWACIDLISSDISRLPLEVLQRQYDKKGRPAGRTLYKNHPAWTVMRRPNSFQTMQQFIQQYLVSKLTHGNTYVIIFRDGRGVPKSFYILDPRLVEPLIDDEGNIYYRVGADKIAGIKEAIVVPARDIVHDRMVCLFHPLVGVSPLFAAGMSAMQGIQIQINSSTFFANMSRSSGVLSAPGKIDKELAKQMQANWEQNYSAAGIGKVAVLSNGLKYDPMTITAADAELVNQLRWVVEDIARVYHVPTYKIGEQGKVTFKNAEQQASDYMSNCLSYHIQSFQQLFDQAFGLPDDISIEFNTDKLFEIETDLRYDNHGKALNAGWKSINEVRDEEDLAPVEGGDEPRVQVQYVPLSKANGDGVAGVTPPAPAGDPATPTPPKPATPPAPTKAVASVDVAKMLTRFSDNLLKDEAN